ncbi:hypothetical protein [Maribacter flavus]|uniref:DNA primase n=1 Tax=Maribacter flavus TaxID=1658664 RepID=A0A5B2TVY2_9FLAO|nr:hypothetical protein [Maribacter flavus]KAA2218283.1 hypothetical protein F0361_01285 [Maribacter flavus]
MSYVKIEDLMDATQGGLNIIATYYPEAPHALSTKHRKFKARGDEKTASASIRQKENGWYYVTDFGGDGKERNAVEVCMLEEGLTFGEACAELGARFSVSGAPTATALSKPIIERRDRQEGEIPGSYFFEYKEFEASDLLVLGPKVTDKDCFAFNLKLLASYTYIKEDGVTITKSTPEYPIFSFHHEKWQKIYQPNSLDKGYRFRYAGDKPQKYIHGLDAIKTAFRQNKERIEDEWQRKDASTEKMPDVRLESCFIVSGGSDGLNLKSFGYFPIWFNSESEHLDYADYKLLMTMVQTIYYIADLDATGMNQAVKVGLKFLDIRLLWLPKQLLQYRDKRGNPRKDFKDFVEVYYKEGEELRFNNRFKKLIEVAVPMKFWEESYSDGGIKYYFKNTRAYHFLQHQGFGRYENQNTKDGYVFVRQHHGIVKVIKPVDVKGFATNFLIERQMPENLRDVIYKTSQLSENSLSNLPYVEIDFTDADAHSQHIFFQNEVWKVTKEGIERIRYDQVQCLTWEDKVVDHRVRLQDPHFEIKKDKSGNWDIEIKRTDNQFLNYLINTSRVHWKKDLEEAFGNHEQLKAEEYAKRHKFDIAGPNLTEDEIYEQKLHLINKIFTLGYMLHKYKNPGKPWAPYAMDHKIADIAESHGGTGKSVFVKSIQHVLKNNHYINGRDKKKTSDDFIYHGVTEHTDYILIDDCHAYMDYGFFYNTITGDLDVNNKNGLRYIIPFAKSPKVAFASNYPPNDLDPSLERRLLYVVFSDYYHYNKDDEYQQTRTVADDFGKKNLFQDFDEKQWNIVLNFFAQALRFYLSCDEKLSPPMENVEKRNLLKEMGDQFHSWADVFFSTKRNESEEYLYLDIEVSKQHAFENFEKTTNAKRWSANRFKKSLKAYAKYNGWIFNPKDRAPGGRIIKKVDGESVEHFYIRTKKGLPEELKDIPVDVEDDEWTDDDTELDEPF